MEAVCTKERVTELSKDTKIIQRSRKINIFDSLAISISQELPFKDTADTIYGAST